MSNTITLSPPEAVESIRFLVTKKEYPIFWENKVRCLMSAGDCREEAERVAENFFKDPIEMEIVYETGLGFFGIESEAIEGGAECVSPFSKVEIVDSE